MTAWCSLSTLVTVITPQYRTCIGSDTRVTPHNTVLDRDAGL